ncbi:MAG: hypothetical protein D3917_06015 [Candidatus Electrothrix sp. AX5]|nr:hypothetical protein [Candidatus Electrothrix sp. AX5]
MLTHEELKKKILNNPDIEAKYDGLKEEFTLFDELLNAKIQAGQSQDDWFDAPGVSDDFMEERDQPDDQIREAL